MSMGLPDAGVKECSSGMELAKLVLDYIAVLVWPTVVLVLSILFRGQLKALIERVTHAELPGGVAIDMGREIQEAQILSAKVEATPPREEIMKRRDAPSIPLTEANARMLHLGLRPSPSGLDMSYYRTLAQQDPNLALAGLRIEIDILARNLAKGFRVDVEDRDSGSRLLRKLHSRHAITSEQLQLGLKVLRLGNAAAHGIPISLADALAVIDIAEVLANQYLAWLGWGFGDDWRPSSGQ